LQKLGERKNDTTLLEEAIQLHRAALEEMTRDRNPIDWATMQSDLGSALQVLGERESGTARLEAAITAWRSCPALRCRCAGRARKPTLAMRYGRWEAERAGPNVCRRRSPPTTRP